jgi:hypothetical protein
MGPENGKGMVRRVAEQGVLAQANANSGKLERTA